MAIVSFNPTRIRTTSTFKHRNSVSILTSPSKPTRIPCIIYSNNTRTHPNLRHFRSNSVSESSVSIQKEEGVLDDLEEDDPTAELSYLDPETKPESITEWELDFCSRPILDVRGKKVWELLVCDNALALQYTKYFPNNVINSITLKDAIVTICEELGVPLPEKIRFFRSQMQTIITKACKELGITPIPSKRVGDFIYKVSSMSPTKHFIIHSRKALLNGISPAENRSIPPLKYEYFYGLLRDFPDLTFTINGGITSVDEVNEARRAGAHGVMVGRAAYNNPWQILGHVDTAIYGEPSSGLTRRQVLEKYQVYGDSVLGMYGRKPNVRDIMKPLLNFFHSEPGNGLWKRKADAAFQNRTTIKSFLDETLVAIPDSVLDSPIGELQPGRPDLFANVESILPPPYTRTREEDAIYA